MKILVIQTAFIGDAILSTGMLSEIKRLYPEAQLDLITTPVSSSLFANNPHLCNVYTFRKTNLLHKCVDFIKLVSSLKKQKYDWAVSVQVHLTNSLLMLFSGIKKRVGSARMKFLTHPVKLPKKLLVIERNAYILEHFANQPVKPGTELHFSQEISAKAKRITDAKGFKLGIAPGSVWPTKRWPEEYFVKLLQQLDLDTAVFLIGGREDRQLCEKLVQRSETKANNLAGKLSLLESAAVIQNLDLLLTNDSAPLHMANAVKTDVVAIFGPTVKRFGCYPYRENDTLLEVALDCRPCGKHGSRKCPLGHHKCMRNINPEIVIETIEKYRKSK